MAKARSKTPPRELVTVLDFIRYAVTRFVEAKLAFGQGTYDPAEDAMFLVGEALHLPIDRIDPFLPAKLTAAERQQVFALIDKRVRTRTPSAYLVNCAYLQGHRFYVDERVIVPRSYIAELLYGDLFKGDDPLIDAAGVTRVLDLCTGSGCLAILAAHAFPDAQIDAVDISKDALDVAAINVAEHGLDDRVRLLKGDLFKPVKEAVYDLIISNPPYVDTKAVKDFAPELTHEPRVAHAGGVDGLDIVRRILAEAPAHLSADGGLLCELGRGGPVLQRDFPEKEFLWLETEQSEGEVFWISAAGLRD